MNPFLTTGTPKHVAVLDVAPDVFVAMCQQHNVGRRLFVENPLPDDVRIVTATYDQHRRVFTLLLESEAFSLVESGLFPPRLSPQPVLRVEYEEVPA